MALPRNFHGCGHGTFRGSVRGKGRRTNHGNPRKSAANATKFFAQTAVAFSTAIPGHCLGNAAITTEVRGSRRQLPRHFPRASIRSNFHGHPWPSAAITTIILRYAANTTEVRGVCHSTCRGSVRGKFRRTNHTHGSPRHLPRPIPQKLLSGV